MTAAAPTGVLLMAYGAARGPEDLARYYTHIRRGRPPTADQLADLRARYDAIGGHSPLLDITARQAAGLQKTLERRHGASRYRTYLGFKHCAPFIADAVETMRQDGIQQAIGLVLAPHYSDMSVGVYLREAEAFADPPARVFKPVKAWHTEPGLIRLLADRVSEALSAFAGGHEAAPTVIFTAHSLPERIRAQNDPYPAQVEKTGHLVAELLQYRPYAFSWQSAGRTEEPWMGPDILDTLTRLRDEGRRRALICPVGFVSDHLEILYDLDVQAQSRARALGMDIRRTRSLNDDPAFLDTLADIVNRVSAPS